MKHDSSKTEAGRMLLTLRYAVIHKTFNMAMTNVISDLSHVDFSLHYNLSSKY